MLSLELAQDHVSDLARDSASYRRSCLSRRGQVQEIIVGTDLTLSATTLSKFRVGARSLRGLRVIRTQLHDQPLSQESLTDLAYLRLDLFGAFQSRLKGNPGNLYLAHLLPPNGTGQVCNILKHTPFQQRHLAFDRFIEDLEADIQRAAGLTR